MRIWQASPESPGVLEHYLSVHCARRSFFTTNLIRWATILAIFNRMISLDHPTYSSSWVHR